jgi:hypothetical protein
MASISSASSPAASYNRALQRPALTQIKGFGVLTPRSWLQVICRVDPGFAARIAANCMPLDATVAGG